MSKQFHPLKVKEVRKETPEAVSVTFEVPAAIKDTFSYKHGQYLTLRFDINGQEVRRAYSMCSSPIDEHITVTVKRVNGGKVSNFIHDRIKPGSMIDVMPPEGRFFTDLHPENNKTYYLFGAGSGITPLMSILRTILEEEPLSTVFLLYGNRTEESIIFRETLGELSSRYAGQFVVEHILSQPPREKAKGLAGFFKKGALLWEGRTGRIDDKEVRRFLNEHPPRSRQMEYFICGPGNMIDTVESTLHKLEVDKKHIHTEHFLSATPKPGTSAEPSKAGGAQVKVHLDGQEIALAIPEGKTILDALIAEGYDPPYSCTAGACSTCMAKVLRGSVNMDTCFALDDEEVEEGYILTCQSHPATDEVEVTFQV